MLRDISARQRAEDALRQAIRSRDEMMGIVSHDLRNPANAVKMLARSILEVERRQGRSSGVAESVQIIQQAAEQIDSLIQDLLDITRLEAGRLAVAPKPVDPEWLVSRSVDALRPLAEAGQVSLQADVAPDVDELHADPDRLLQLLSNLIGNAIKFTPAGGRVTVTVRRTAEGVLFMVADNGQGIPVAQLPHVFDRFFQSAGSTTLGVRHGAGLGLPIARGIVEAHHGQIWIESAEGAGTTVRFVLPSAPIATGE
ncbi:MAG TPA: HAMP domain-containing sensor histidine kinase [Gemmatimonadaceae bacterium]